MSDLPHYAVDEGQHHSESDEEGPCQDPCCRNTSRAWYPADLHDCQQVIQEATGVGLLLPDGAGVVPLLPCALITNKGSL